VIGTSRLGPAAPGGPFSFPLLTLDITSDASVNAFVTALLAHPAYPGQVDILINNVAKKMILRHNILKIKRIENSSCGLSLLPIIGHHSGNQHTNIVSSMYYQQEFLNRIDPERTVRLPWP